MSIVTRRGDSWARNLARFVANMRRSPTGVSHSLAACLRGFHTRFLPMDLRRYIFPSAGASDPC
jgi:hypothetical protein